MKRERANDSPWYTGPCNLLENTVRWLELRPVQESYRDNEAIGQIGDCLERLDEVRLGLGDGSREAVVGVLDRVAKRRFVLEHPTLQRRIRVLHALYMHGVPTMVGRPPSAGQPDRHFAELY